MTQIAHKRRLGLIVATAFGISTMALLASFFVRTRAFLGPVVEKRLQAWAERHGAAVQIASMRPTGVSGLRFGGVDLVVRRGNVRAAIAAESLDIRPSLSALLEGELAVGAARLSGARVTVSPLSSAGEPVRRSGESAPRVSNSETPPPTQPGDRTSESLDVELDDVELRARLPESGVRSRRLHIDYAAFRLDPQRGLAGLKEASGWGDLPNGVGFAVSTAHAAPTEENSERGRRIRFEPHGNLSLNALLDASLPGRFTFGSVAACPDCRSPQICLRDIRVSSRSIGLRSPEACARLNPSTIEAAVAETKVRGPAGRRLGRVTEIRGTLPADGDAAELRARFRRLEGGSASVKLRWSPGASPVELRLRTRRLRLRPIGRTLDLSVPLPEGRLDSRLRARLHPGIDLVEASLRGRLEEGSLAHPLLDDDPVALPPTHFEIDATSDLGGTHVSFPEARLALGALRPLRLRGEWIDAGDGGWLEAEIDAKRTDLRALRRILPGRLVRPADGAVFDGRISAHASLSAHTAYPESLRLDVGFEGDVDVRRESPRVDVHRLASNGPPDPTAIDSTIGMPTSEWVSLQSLPSHVPRVLLAAEDTQFFRHSGFSWQGIGNALSHNLKVGELARGGSTITQQVAKNLFLTKRRTLTRKIREAWITWRLESVLPKERILELYLNVADWGPDVQGLHGAAAHFFDREPDDLSVAQMTLLSAILPGPEVYGTAIDRGYLPSSRLEKVEHILNNLEYLDVIDQESYEKLYGRARKGAIGGLDLTVCRDDRHAPENAPDCP